MTIQTMTDLYLSGKRVLIRQDLNVPIANGRVTSDKRIRAGIPTLEKASAAGAGVLVISHLGRPEEGKYDETFSLAPVARSLEELMGRPVRFEKNWLEGVNVAPGEIVVCENVRFNPGEKKNEETLGQKMAALCDIFVMDAFGTAHRAQASTHSVAKYAPLACAGPLLAGELEALGKALKTPERPLLAIVGGSKVSTKLTVLESLSSRVDQLIVGGGIANTFIAAAGYPIGKSLVETDLIDEAKRLTDAAKEKGAEIPVPEDVVCAKEFSEQAEATTKSVTEVDDDDLILDIGPKTAQRYTELIHAAGTVVWNGPVGVFEFDQFGSGTAELARAIADSTAFSIAGGGDTLAAIEKYNIEYGVSYSSTGGGAFLEFLEGKQLPAVDILEQKSA